MENRVEGIKDGMIVISKPTGTVLNSSGRRIGDSVHVSAEECASLHRRGLVDMGDLTAADLLDASSAASYVDFMAVDVLKSNGFILKTDPESSCLFGYRPGLRTKKLLESEPAYQFSSVEPDAAFSIEGLHPAAENVVFVTDGDGSYTSIRVSCINEVEFTVDKV